MARRFVALAAALGALLTFVPLACSSSSGSGAPAGGGSGGSHADASGGAAGSGGTASGGTAGSGGADGGCAPGATTLRNDGFDHKGQVAFQGGFAQGECWASTYVPAACGYQVSSVLVLVGGGDAGNVQFDVSVWDVDSGGKPTNKLGSMGATITGASDVLSEIPLDSLGVPARNGTPFAIAMCQNSHSGPPSIGSDTDGITPKTNWIYTGGQWVEAGTLGVKGDWIMRAKINVQ
jgi:hypothetical protein